MTTIQQIQQLIGATTDGLWGPRSQAALERAIAASDTRPHATWATSFADPADISAFRRCSLQGGTERQCLQVGDNGIGHWGDDTTVSTAMCALPIEDYQHLGDNARGVLIRVTIGERTVDCELRDSMGHKRSRPNGAGIDLNAEACRLLAVEPPLFTRAEWTFRDPRMNP